MKENTIKKCIICGKAGDGVICRDCGDPEIVIILYKQYVIKMTPVEFFKNNIRRFLVKDGITELSTPDKCAGLVIKVKTTQQGEIDSIDVFKARMKK